MDILAENSDQLIQALKGMDFSVPAHGAGQTKEHIERITIRDLLALLLDQQRIRFPFSLQKRESPDYILSNGIDQVGIEVTEASPKQLKEVIAYLEKNCDEYIIDTGHFRPGRRPVPKKELHHVAKSISSPPYHGKEQEVEWALMVRESIDSKVKKLRSNTFSKFNKNWLAISSFTSLSSDLFAISIKYLKDDIYSMWERNDFFDMIFVRQNQNLSLIDRYGSFIKGAKELSFGR